MDFSQTAKLLLSVRLMGLLKKSETAFCLLRKALTQRGWQKRGFAKSSKKNFLWSHFSHRLRLTALCPYLRPGACVAQVILFEQSFNLTLLRQSKALSK